MYALPEHQSHRIRKNSQEKETNGILGKVSADQMAAGTFLERNNIESYWLKSYNDKAHKPTAEEPGDSGQCSECSDLLKSYNTQTEEERNEKENRIYLFVYYIFYMGQHLRGEQICP